MATQAEIFQASYEQAYSREPLTTALLDRTAAKKLVSHIAICYMYSPMLVDKTIPVDLDDYDKTVPGMMIWISDAKDPLFKMGRWAQIQGRKFPSDPFKVALNLRIDNNPNSFVEPT